MHYKYFLESKSSKKLVHLPKYIIDYYFIHVYILVYQNSGQLYLILLDF